MHKNKSDHNESISFLFSLKALIMTLIELIVRYHTILIGFT